MANNFNKKENTECTNCNTKQCFVQKFCEPTWIGIINHSKNLAWYEKGQYIFREGDRVFGLNFILHGKVKVISSGLNGKNQIVRFAGDGEILGHRGYGNEIYPVGAIALEDTGICFVDNATLLDAFLNNPKFTYELMSYYSKELRKAEIRLRFLAQMSLREKMAETLLSLWEIFGEDKSDGSLNVTLSRQELADFSGTTAEQATRALSEFENESLIEKRGKKIALLSIDGLHHIIAAHSRNKYFAAKAE